MILRPRRRNRNIHRCAKFSNPAKPAGGATFKPLPGTLIRPLTLLDSPSQSAAGLKPRLTVPIATAHVRYFPLLSGRIEISDVSLEKSYFRTARKPGRQIEDGPLAAFPRAAFAVWSNNKTRPPPEAVLTAVPAVAEGGKCRVA